MSSLPGPSPANSKSALIRSSELLKSEFTHGLTTKKENIRVLHLPLGACPCTPQATAKAAPTNQIYWQNH